MRYRRAGEVRAGRFPMPEATTREMARRIFALAVLAGSACCSGCAGGPCQSTFQYSMDSQLPGPTYTSCEVDISAGHSVARYTFPDPCGPLTTQIASPQGNSPADDFCQIGQCSIYLDFTDHARALAKFVGSTTLTMRVACDGVLLDTQTIKPITGLCPS